jgi:predicted ATP-binding protein involved in virulence
MKLVGIDIHNFRCFENIKAEGFHDQMNVIIANNGGGKTAFLDALIMIVSTFLNRIAEGQSKTPKRGDIRLKFLENSIEKATPLVLKARIDVGENKMIEFSRELNSEKGKLTTMNAKDFILWGEDQNIKVKKGIDVKLPLLSYYATGRIFTERKNTGTEAGGSRLRGYYNATETTSNYVFIKKWFKTEELKRLQSKESSLIQYNEAGLESVKHVLVNAIESALECYYDIEYDDISFYFSDKRRLPVFMLSDGYRSIISLFVDIATRCFLLNPNLGKEAPILTKGIVMIDEIDLHLHPSWQRGIVGKLQQCFPNIQFFVTTHSPQVLSSVKNGYIYQVSPQELRKMDTVYGQDSNYILRASMEVAERPVEVWEKIELYNKLVDEGKGNEEQAKSLRKEIEDIFGENPVELIESDLKLGLIK